MNKRKREASEQELNDAKKIKTMGQIRVGRCTYEKKGKRVDPFYAGFTPIIVLTASSEYGALGPYVLKNEQGQIMENIWQFSKIYAQVPETTQRYSRWDKRITWQHGSETHYANSQLTDAYWAWRKKGYNAKDAIRYPVGKKHAKTCIGAIYSLQNDNTEPFEDYKLLNYVQARIQIYAPIYCNLVKKHAMFAALKKRLEGGENLLIIEVDGPHQESLDYYKTKYTNVDDSFIEHGTMLVTREHIQIMLHDTKHAFGHGYCLAMALLEKDKEWLQ